MDHSHAMVIGKYKIKPGDDLATCDHCGSGIRHVYRLSNGWILGRDCIRSATIVSPGFPGNRAITGRRFLTHEAYDKIASRLKK